MKTIYFLYLLFNICNALKTISITSGGLHGFYMFGICKFIKKNYGMEKTILYGASAGAWNSLYLSLKEDNDNFESYISSMNVSKVKNLYTIENNIKKSILSNYDVDDFYLNKNNICVGVIEKYRIKRKIFSQFDSLEDIIDCCMASSHIPYITNGALLYKYKKYNCLDGGIFPLPNPDSVQPSIIIEPNIWNNKEIDKYSDIRNLNIPKLIELGYEDSIKNKYELDFLLKYD